MNTKKIFSTLVRTGTRLAIFASMLMAAFMGNVAGVAASGPYNLSGITVGAQTGTLTYGTVGTVTYSVQVSRNFGSPNSFNLSVSGLPSGATSAVYNQTNTTLLTNPISFGGNSSRTVTLRVTTSATTPVGSPNFTVTAAQTGATTQNNNSRAVVIQKANQTINFGALASKTTSDPDFNVSATASSSLSVSFAAAGACTIGGTLVHLTGAGSCTITASQAGNGNYNAATSVNQAFTITAAGSTTSFDLYAVTGSTTLPGGVTATVWGYNTTNAAVTKPGGPVLVVNQNDTVVITLHNQLAESTALLFQGQNMIPDQTGVAANGTKTYTFNVSQPGTFLYEAGLLPNAQHQVPMGLYGALVVRPTGFAAVPGQAYGSSSTAFDAEQVLVLSELDTALNNGADPAAFDMRTYNPKYYLINGKAFPSTDPVSVTAGNKVLLRYVNAGLQAHAMSTLGFSQNIIAQDGNAYAFSHSVVAETIATGQTLDTLVTIPAGAVAGAQYPLYDASLFLRNNTGNGSSAGVGGMLTMLTVGTATPPSGDVLGPVASGLNASPNPTNGADVTVSANISDATTGNSNVTAAELYVDTTSGSPTLMTGSFGSPTVSVTGTVPAATLAILAPGNHTAYVRGQDSAGNWGSFASVTFNLDTAGPGTGSLNLSPNPTNGSVDVSLTGVATDTNNIVAAEYSIDGGAAQPMTVNIVGSNVSLSATISAAVVNALSSGNHTVAVRSQDDLGIWGAVTNVTLIVDKVAPAASDIVASPNPNNGATPFNTSVPAVRVTADFSDNTTVIAAEGFIDVAGADGTGFVFIATDGVFNNAAESGYADIPLPVVNTLSDGDHALCIHAKDAAGNWGAVDCTYKLTIDRTPPAISSITRADANPTNATTVNFTVTFSENVIGVTSSNFTAVRVGLTGTSTMTLTGSGSIWNVAVTTGSGFGTIGLNLTSATGINDLAGNALPSAAVPFVGQVYTILPPVSGNLYFSTSGTVTPGLRPGGVVGADTADIYYYNGSAFSTAIDVSAITGPIPAGANVDGFDRVDATHFYMSFSSDTAVPGLGTVQDEDVVYYNAGTWSVYFDGTAHGMGASGNLDLDAISVDGGTLYFSTTGNTNPPGVGGTADDADIYSWNGTSYARVWDATANGLTTGPNVDGFVRIDATHFYLSFSNSDTALSGIPGNVQDEDVVYNNNGVWSVYFDGTGLGLTDSALDVDAFDVP